MYIYVHLYISLYLFNDIFIVIYKSNLKPPATYIPSGAPCRENHGVTKMPVTVLFNTKKKWKRSPRKGLIWIDLQSLHPKFHMEFSRWD